MPLTLDSSLKPATGWKRVCALDDIPVLGSRVVRTRNHGDVALFRTADGEVFALHDRCPHKGGPLSQGIVHGRTVTCPLHAWKVQLDDGRAVEPDVGCTATFAVTVDADGGVLLSV
ncbi:MAG: nitrite reductase small subunit NirD [Burkholderiales bacterium]